MGDYFCEFCELFLMTASIIATFLVIAYHTAPKIIEDRCGGGIVVENYNNLENLTNFDNITNSF